MREGAKEKVRAEWRELGFFYRSDADARQWLLVGSRTGLLRFAELLRACATDPRNDRESEHEHYGPYRYLEVMTWPSAGMDGHAIHGPVGEIARLATLVEQSVAELEPGERARIREAYAESAEYTLVLELREDGFDPASADEDPGLG